YGYDLDSVLSARMGLMDGDYPSDEARKRFYDRLLRDCPAVPDFEAVALTNRFRMLFSGNVRIELEGKTYADNRDRPTVNFEQIACAYFAATGQRVLEGRPFTDDDADARQPVAIVN